MIDSKFRTPYQRFFIDPLLKLPLVQKIDPKIITLLGLSCGLAIVFFLPRAQITLSLICLVISGFFDTLDGSIARFNQRTSAKGAALDITADRLVEFTVVFSLFWVNPQTRGVYCILMLGSILFCITTFLVVGIFSQNESNKSFYYSSGLVERAEAFVFFALMMAFPSLFIPCAILFTILVSLTGLLRLLEFLRRH